MGSTAVRSNGAATQPAAKLASAFRRPEQAGTELPT